MYIVVDSSSGRRIFTWINFEREAEAWSYIIDALPHYASWADIEVKEVNNCEEYDIWFDKRSERNTPKN